MVTYWHFHHLKCQKAWWVQAFLRVTSFLYYPFMYQVIKNISFLVKLECELTYISQYSYNQTYYQILFIFHKFYELLIFLFILIIIYNCISFSSPTYNIAFTPHILYSKVLSNYSINHCNSKVHKTTVYPYATTGWVSSFYKFLSWSWKEFMLLNIIIQYAQSVWLKNINQQTVFVARPTIGLSYCILKLIL